MNNDDKSDFIKNENEEECPSSGIEYSNIDENVSNYSGNNNNMNYDDDDDDDDIEMDPGFQYFQELKYQSGCVQVNFRCSDFSAANEFGEGTSSGSRGNAFYYFRPGESPVAPERSHDSQDPLSMQGWDTENASGSDQPRSILPGWGQENSNEIEFNRPYPNMQEWDEHDFENQVSDPLACDIFEEMMEWQEECRGLQTNYIGKGTEELKKFANIQEMADYLESIILMLAIYLWCDQTIAENEEREKEKKNFDKGNGKDDEKKNFDKGNGKDDDSGNPV